jgi:Carboxypeptidase regulatory-like domain
MALRIFLVSLVCVSALAQTAQLSGIITDPTGQGIPEADIQIRNEGTGVIRTTKSTAEGDYTIPTLAPGSYVLRVQKSGFKTAERSSIILQTDSNIRFDVALSVGEVAETVTVQDAPPLTQDTPDIGTTITRREYESLPLIQIGRIRSPAAFVLIAPGVQGTVRLDGSQYTSASNQVEVHGQANFTIEYLMDGLPAGWQTGNLNESAPSVDAIGSFV